MPIYEITPDKLVAIPPTKFAEAGLFERTDLQRLLRDQIEILSPDTLVLAEEFADWQDSKRRIDLLGIDRDAKLVVIELKRTDDGGHMELQALRYAAMVSTMTFERAVAVLARFRSIESEDAQAQILDFLGWDEPDEERFAQDVRIVLASAEFSKELTTAVLWLNQRDLDIRCVRLRPYRDGARVLIDVAQVLPLPEAQDYQVRLREKETRERATPSRSSSPKEFLTELRAEDVPIAEALTMWAHSQSLHLDWRRGKERGSVAAILSLANRDSYTLFAIRTDGVLVMRMEYLAPKPALEDGKLLATFRDALEAMPGIEVAGELDRRPRFAIGKLSDASAMSRFQAAMGALIDGVKAWYAALGVAIAHAEADTDGDD